MHERKEGSIVRGKQKNRRDFLALLSAAAATTAINPFDLFVKGMQGGLFAEALAEAAGISPRRFVLIHNHGAPPRWVFDNFLKTQNSDAFVANTMVKTSFSGSANNYTNMNYKLTEQRGILVPHLWSTNVPSGSGGNKPLANLLDNMMVVRGIDTGNAAHVGSAMLVSRPAGTDATVGGLVADTTHLPLPAVSMNVSDVQTYLSRRGISTVDHNTRNNSNNINILLRPFQQDISPSLKATKQAFDGLLNEAVNSLDRSVAKYSSGLKIDSDNANRLLKNGFEDLGSSWNQIFGKYRNIISQALTATIPGINDRRIGVGQNRNGQYRFRNNIGNVTNNDLRSMITSGTSIVRMAENFAMTEFLLTRGYTSFINFRLDGQVLRGLRVETSNGNSTQSLRNDQHDTGAVVGLLANSIFYYALGACLLELTESLKTVPASVSAIPFRNPPSQGTLFEDTIIQYGSEFNRSPRQNGTGSDHGYYGTSFSFFSGSIKGPLVLGDLAADTGHSNYSGTWGVGAPNPELNNRYIGLGNLAATQATLVRVDNPSPNNSSVVRVDGNLVTPLLRQGKVVG